MMVCSSLKNIMQNQAQSKVVNSGEGLISQQEKFSMVKIQSYGGLLKWEGAL